MIEVGVCSLNAGELFDLTQAIAKVTHSLDKGDFDKILTPDHRTASEELHDVVQYSEKMFVGGCGWSLQPDPLEAAHDLIKAIETKNKDKAESVLLGLTVSLLIGITEKG